jgi:hypothetical protein
MTSTFNPEPRCVRYSSNNTEAITAALTLGDGDEERTAYRTCPERVAALGVDVVSKTVDLVIVAGNSSAISAAIDAARRGMRVMVVIGSTRLPLIRRLRRALRAAGTCVQRGVTVFTNAR